MHKRELRAMHDLRNAAKRVAEALARHPKGEHVLPDEGWNSPLRCRSLSYGDGAQVLLAAVEAAIAMAREVDAIEPREDA
jgi:hypothetical protein